MLKSSRVLIVSTVAAVLLWAGPGISQVVDQPGDNTERHSVPVPAPDSFGTGYQSYVIPAADFTPQGNVVSGYSGSGYIFRSGGTRSTYWAPIMLPAGSLIQYMVAYVYDSSDTDDITFTWGAYSLPFAQTTTPSYIEFMRTSDSGDSGYNLMPLVDGSTIIRYYTDLDNDGYDNTTCYRVSIDLPVTNDTLRFAGVMVGWYRTVSPAPATATFNDVQPGDFGFQHIEALAASGITAGCGGGNFCPNGTLTRAQMAVFLAKALGLHWIN